MNMSMLDLYDTMKASLDFFGLSFSEMDKVTIEIEEGKLILSYGKKKITLQSKEHN